MRIIALQDAGNLQGATELAVKLVADLERSAPTSVLLPAAVDRLAMLQDEQGNYAEAMRLYERGVELWRQYPGSPNMGLAKALNNLASLYSEIGQVKKAETLRRESLELRLRLLGPTSPEVAICYANLAVDLLHQDNYEDSEQLAKQAIEIWSHGPSDKAETDLAYNTLARIELHAGNYSAALKHIQLAVQVYDQRGKGNPLRLSAYQHTLALAKQGSGDSEGAAQAYQTSLGTIDKTNAPLSIQRVVILEDYAEFLRTIGQKHEARELKRRAAKELAQLGTNNTLKYSVDVNALLSSQR